jgi:hypothetical protein
MVSFLGVAKPSAKPAARRAESAARRAESAENRADPASIGASLVVRSNVPHSAGPSSLNSPLNRAPRLAVESSRCGAHVQVLSARFDARGRGLIFKILRPTGA